MATFHITHHQTGNTFLAKFSSMPTHGDIHAAIAQYESSLKGQHAKSAWGFTGAARQGGPAPHGVTSRYFTGLPDPNSDDNSPQAQTLPQPGPVARRPQPVVTAPDQDGGDQDAEQLELAAALREQHRRQALAAAEVLRSRQHAHGHR